MNQPKKYINSYVAGMLLGLMLLLSFALTGGGLGSSGSVKRTAIYVVDKIAPNHTQNAEYYKPYIKEGETPLSNSMVYIGLGTIIGGFVSSLISGRFQKKIAHSPSITPKKRLIFALIGGALFGFGAQFGRGCTSGAALSGMAVMATSGFLLAIAIFGTGYLLAYFFRKIW